MRSCTSAIPCLDGASGGGHTMTQQNWPHQSSSDRPRKSYPLLWEMFPSRRPEQRQGKRCHIYTYHCWYLVDKSAHLTANPLTIQEGQWMIAQAIIECWIGWGDLDIHILIQQHHKHSDSIMEISPHGKKASKTLALTIGLHTPSHHKAGIVSGGKETQGWCYPNPLTFPWLRIWKQ